MASIWTYMRALPMLPLSQRAIINRQYWWCFRKAKGKMEFGDYEVARKIARQAHTLDPNDQSIGKLLQEIAKWVPYGTMVISVLAG